MIRINSFLPEGNWAALTQFLGELTRRSVDVSDPNFRVLKHRLVNKANATQISATVSETNFDVSRTLSRGVYKEGSIFKFDIFGSYGTVTPGTSTGFTFRLKFNTANVIVFGKKTGVTDASAEEWRITGGLITRTIGTGGFIMPYGTLYFNTGVATSTVETNSQGAIAVNTESTTEIVFQLSVQMDSSNANCDLHSFILEVSDF